MAARREHDVDELGVYVLGLLDDDRSAMIEDHLMSCVGCRELVDELVGVHELLAFAPATAFVDPPARPDLVTAPAKVVVPLRRRQWPKVAALVAAAATVVGLAVGTGVLIGRGTTDGGLAAPQAPPTSAQPAPLVPGVRFAANTGAGGARLTARLEPADGWVRVNASVAGIPAGERCQLVVVSRDGGHAVAASWLVSAKGEASGTNLDGAVLVAPADVVSLAVESLDGREFVATRI